MAFVAKTSEIVIRKAEGEKHRRRSENYVEVAFMPDNEAKCNCSRLQQKLHFSKCP